MRITEIPNFDRLSDQERLALADEIMGSLKNPDALPPPLTHRAELDRRWAAYLTQRPPVGATLHLEPYDPPTGPMP